jgi:hypothetical protein
VEQVAAEAAASKRTVRVEVDVTPALSVAT